MSTRERRTDRAAVRRRTTRSLCLLFLLPGAAVGSAHGVPTASSWPVDPGPGTAATSTAEAAATTTVPVAPAASFNRWATATLLSGPQPGIGRPLRATPPVPTAVPGAALAAYQRAAAVLAVEAPSCALDWSLLAAIGHVESDHGRRGSSALGADGVSRPGVVGPVVDAPGSRGPLPDTDGGDLDGTATEDRAVGALQLLPSAWTAAAVDGDADGVRNPQDVDDASLAAGVLLCTSAPALSSEAGLRQALHRYNPTAGYVDTVQRLATAYALTETVAGVVATAIDVVAGPPLLIRAAADATEARTATVAAAAGTTRVVAGAGSPTPVVTPSARETVPATVRTMGASGSPSPQASGSSSAVPSAIVTSEATEAASPSENASTPTPRPTGTSEPAPASAADPGPGPTPEPEPGSTPEPTAGAGSTDEPAPSSGPTEPAPSSGPTEPAPSSGPTEPAPSTEPGGGDTTAPAPSPSPDLRTVSGVWSLTGASTFLLDGTTAVDLDALGDLTAPATADLDGDGVSGTILGELTGLVGRTVEVRGVMTSPELVAPRSLDDLQVLAP